VSNRHKAILALAVVLVAWSLSSLFVKFLIPYYDPHTQNVYRYASGMFVMLPFLFARLQNDRRLERRLLWRLLVPTIPNVLHQVSWVVGLIWVYPALCSFLNKSSVLFAAGLAFVFFPEERWLFRSKRFLIGLTLTVLGTLGLALLRTDLGQMQVNLAVLLVLFAAAMWAVYSVAIKRPAAELGSAVSFSVVSIYTTLALLPLALIWGDLGHFRDVPWRVNVIMIFSGVLCIGVAHTLYWYAIREIGVSICATMLLTTPLGTLLLSRWIFGEQLTFGQIIAGIGLLVGGALTLLAKEKPAAMLARAAESADA
jgi:drug/metabolite transporter (DMT)-like permease